MVSVAALWLPILLSAVIVFVASSIMHAVLKYHQRDCHQIPDEDSFRALLGPANLKRGFYFFPYTLPQNMKSPGMIEKYKQGPVGYMTIIPNGAPAMPKFLGQWFIYCVVIGGFVAYLTAAALPVGASYMTVFRVAGTAASLAYGLGHLSNAVWKGQTWSMTTKEVVDGIIYGLLTAGTFGWLWPR